MRPAKVAGSSSEKPEVRSDVSKSRWTKSLTVLSPLSAAALALSSFMIECFGLISMVFLEAMYDDIELSRSAWARMMRSMLAVQPYSPVTRTHGDALRHDHLLDLVAEDLLHEFGEGLEVRTELFPRLLILLRLLELEALLGDRDELLAVVLLELLHAVLVDGVDHEEHLVVALLALLDEGGGLHGLLGLASDVVEVLLRLGHARDVVLEGRLLVAALGRVEHQQLRELGAVARVLVDAELDVLAELLVKLLEVLGVLLDLAEELDALLDNVLLDHLEDLVLLQRLARDVERQVLRVDDALDEGEPLGHQLLAVVHDEDAAHVELDVARVLLLGLEEVKGRALGHKKDGGELELALDPH